MSENSTGQAQAQKTSERHGQIGPGHPAQARHALRGLGLDNLALNDDEIFAAIPAHPILIERPIVVIGDKVALCRPSETVRDLLG
ncbi:MAG: ArsC/Spx/MgsR family protein [Rhodoblastus sp.]